MCAEELPENCLGFEECLHDFESVKALSQEGYRLLEQRISHIESILRKYGFMEDDAGNGERQGMKDEHELMKYVYEGKQEKLAKLLRLLDQRCIKGVAGKRYTFDLEHYTKVSIYAIWKEIGNCLDMKQKVLAEYIINETNLGNNRNTVRKYL